MIVINITLLKVSKIIYVKSILSINLGFTIVIIFVKCIEGLEVEVFT